MVLVSPTTMSPVVKRITGCGPLSQVSQMSQLEITLPMTAPFGMPKYMSKCPKCHNYSIAFNLSSSIIPLHHARYLQAFDPRASTNP
jgi:hypothetical protein